MKKYLIVALFIVSSFTSFPQQDEYYRVVDWKFYPTDVVQLTDSTYQMEAVPFDYNDPGAIQRVVGNYVVDFVGHRFEVIDSTLTTITVKEIFRDNYRTGQAPQTGQIARCYRSVGDGEAKFVGSIDYSPLDESSRWKLNGSDNELLYREFKNILKIEQPDSTGQIAVWNQDSLFFETRKYIGDYALRDSQIVDIIIEGTTNKVIKLVLSNKDTIQGTFIDMTGEEGSGDNWGTDYVLHDLTLSGKGILGNILKVDTSIISTIANVKELIHDSLSTTNLNLQHGELFGLLNDDHPQYSLTNGSRPFISTIAAGADATLPEHLVRFGQTKSLVRDSLDIVRSTKQDKFINGSGFLKNNGSGIWSYDNSTYLTSFIETDPTVENATITLQGTAVSSSPQTFTLNQGSNKTILINDSQDLSLSGNTISLTNDATAIDISTSTAVQANTAKVSNATHTGDVIGSTTLTYNNTVPVNKGGTGQTSYTNGQLLVGNTTGNTLTKATLTQGLGAKITNGAGSVTVAVDTSSTAILSRQRAVNTYQPKGTYLTAEVDGSTTNELQTLSFASPNLSISSGNSVDLSGVNTDSQTLSIDSSQSTVGIKISGSNSRVSFDLNDHTNRVALDAVSGTNTGDNATNTTSNSYSDSKVIDAIVDGVTTVAPSQNAVFDALILKQSQLNGTGFVKATGTTISYDNTSYVPYVGATSHIDLNYQSISNASAVNATQLSGSLSSGYRSYLGSFYFEDGLVYNSYDNSSTDTPPNSDIGGQVITMTKTGPYTEYPTKQIGGPGRASTNEWYVRSREEESFGDWNLLYHNGNVNNSSVNWTVKDATLSTHAMAYGQFTSKISGTTNYIPKFTGVNSIGNSQIFDNGTNVGIGTTTPSEKLEVVGIIRATASGNPWVKWTSTETIYNDNRNWEILSNAGAWGNFSIRMSPTKNTNASISVLTFNKNGNAGIGTTVPIYKFVVSNGGALGFEVNPEYLNGESINLLAYNRSTSSYKPLYYNASSHIFGQGNVVINTTDNGIDKLQVNGSALASSYKTEIGATINEFSIDGSLSGNSDTALPTEKAVKTYVDNLSYVVFETDPLFTLWDKSYNDLTDKPIIQQDSINAHVVGVINGTNNNFTTNRSFISGTSKVYVNGIRQELGFHYVESGTTQIVFIDPYTPRVNERIIIDYKYN